MNMSGNVLQLVQMDCVECLCEEPVKKTHLVLSDHTCTMTPKVQRPKVHAIVDIEEDTRKNKPQRKSNGFVKSHPTTIKGGYPLKLLIPELVAMETGCPWIYPMTYGGGLVAGDHIELHLTVQSNCCALLTSQESLKVYHSPDDLESKQIFTYTIQKGSLLCVLQDPVVCYRDANYRQVQRVKLHHHGNLALLDWFTAGRMARGESWEFSRFLNTLEILIDDQIVLRENIDLNHSSSIGLLNAFKNCKVMGTLVILGEKLSNLCCKLLKLYGQPKEFGSTYNKSCMISASKLSLKGKENSTCINGVYIKIMAQSTVEAYTYINEMIKPLFEVIGGDPFETKY